MKASKPEHPLAGTLLAKACAKDRAFDPMPDHGVDFNADMTRLRGLLYTTNPTQTDADELDDVLDAYLPGRCFNDWTRETVWAQVCALGWMRNPCFRLSMTGAAVRLVEAMHDATAQWMEALAWSRRNRDFDPQYHMNHGCIFGVLIREHGLSVVGSDYTGGLSCPPGDGYHRYCFYGKWMLAFGLDGSIALRGPANDKQRRNIAPLDWQHLGLVVGMLRATQEGAKAAQESHRDAVVSRNTNLRNLNAFMNAATEVVTRAAGRNKVLWNVRHAEGSGGEVFAQATVRLKSEDLRVVLTANILKDDACISTRFLRGSGLIWLSLTLHMDHKNPTVEGGIALHLRQLGEALTDPKNSALNPAQDTTP